MGLAMPVVWSDTHRLHDPAGEVWVGVRTPATELPERAERIRGLLGERGARFVEAEPCAGDALATVHDAALLEQLASAWTDWEAAGLTEDPGQEQVVPYLFPHPSLFAGAPERRATSVAARAGQFAYDTMTLVGPGTWEAAQAAADVAVTAAKLVLGGAPCAYACCRPPGHHVTRSAYGGSCYLNNSAAAAAHLAAAEPDRTIAIVDIDAHHGNGTQAIFRDDPRVLTGSVHVDPEAGWFPHFLGFEDETGPHDANRNVTLAPGTPDEGWVEGVAGLAAWAKERGAEALVVPLGVDAARGDSQSPLAVSPGGFHEAGRILGSLGLPTVLVQEGGYDMDAIGALVWEVLSGSAEGLDG